MALVLSRATLSADAHEIAARLAGRPGLAVCRGETPDCTYVACDPCDVANSLDPEPSLSRAQRPLGDVPRWFGLIPYEAMRGLEGDLDADLRPEPHLSRPLWLRYPAVVRVSGVQVEVIGESAAAVRELQARLELPARSAAVALGWAAPLEPGSLHASRIEHALQEIARGNVYEVNLARRFEMRVRGSASDLLREFEASGLMPHAFSLDFRGLSVVAVSPELCLRLDADGGVLTSPIKGTRPRHEDPTEDARLALELSKDPKECAELTMIIDVERNDLGRVAELGTVRLFAAPEVVALPSVHHRVASVSARVPPGLGRAELMQALLPSGSVTGAPKRRAMQLIRELEPHRRGLYTGVVGFVRHDGGLELKMAIRTLSVRDGIGHYFAGGGIVADSVPSREVEETLWKAERLLCLAHETAESWSGSATRDNE